jgi:hypothetical protein
MRLQLSGKVPDELTLQAMMLSEVVKRILRVKGDIELSSPPRMSKKNIVEFMKRMRISGLSKFEEKTLLSSVNFYANELDAENHRALGAIIIYIEENYSSKLFRDLDYPLFDSDDTESLLDACGSFCNVVAGNFKAGLTQLGYKELYMSHFSTFENEVINGIEYDPTQTQVYEIIFDIKEEKRIVIDLTMGLVPRLSDF